MSEELYYKDYRIVLEVFTFKPWKMKFYKTYKIKKNIGHNLQAEQEYFKNKSIYTYEGEINILRT